MDVDTEAEDPSDMQLCLGNEADTPVEPETIVHNLNLLEHL